MLQLGLQVDQHVPATDQVQTQKRRIKDQILPGKDHHFTQALDDLVAILSGLKITLGQLLSERLEQQGRIATTTRDLHGIEIDVGGKDLHPVLIHAATEMTVQQDRDGVGFLAGCAAGYPHPDLFARSFFFNECAQRVIQCLERVAVAEEARHRNQDVLGQTFKLLGVRRNQLKVSLQVS